MATGGPSAAADGLLRRGSGNNDASGGGSSNANQGGPDNGGSFECNICLDTAKDAVVSLCGHLFCWPCLHQWLETRPLRQVCPVCKAAISRDKVIPLYGRGSNDRSDPRDKLPPRPPGQRTEPDPSSGERANFPGFTGFGTDGGFHMSFGIGAFPFGFFASAFNIHDGTRPLGGHNAGSKYQVLMDCGLLITLLFADMFPGENPDDVFMSKLFLWVAIAFIIWLLLA